MTLPSCKASAATVLIVLFAGCARTAAPPADAALDSATAAAAPTPYGANPAAGGTFTHDGVALYYESYGQGSPLLMVHGNGMSIGSLAAQIEHFRKAYRVIAMDSRDHGRSADSPGPIDYEKMTDDLAALIDYLRLDSVDVLGWSDGGIEALLLGLRHPTKVKKLVSMAANLNPGNQALYKETDELVRTMLGSMPDSVRNTPEGKRAEKVTRMMLKEPNIDPGSLGKVTAPTLVLAGDQDLIRLEHIVEIFNHLPNSQLAILPNHTHMVPYDDPALFNDTVERFLQTPFKKKDRIADLMTSYEKLVAELAK